MSEDQTTEACQARIANKEPFTNAQSVIESREETHGDYQNQAGLAQLTKTLWRSAPGWQKLSLAQRESLDMVATKVSRILLGDPNTADSWLDLAGYSTLIHNILVKGTPL